MEKLDRTELPKELRFYTIKQAAEILNCTPRSVQSYIDSGKINAKMVAGRWQITETDLLEYVNGCKGE